MTILPDLFRFAGFYLRAKYRHTGRLLAYGIGSSKIAVFERVAHHGVSAAYDVAMAAASSAAAGVRRSVMAEIAY